MASDDIQFNDGTAYEHYMGVWSRLVGTVFLDWLAPARGLRWLDVGCGSGAFTDVLFERAAPAGVHGIDPSDAQLTYARSRFASRAAVFHQGDAQALPFRHAEFDAAVMPLVIFFVTDPAKGVAEMARVCRAGGLVAAYAWDMDGGGFPSSTLHATMREMGLPVPQPPSSDASRPESLVALWSGAGLDAIETRQIAVERTFSDFDEYWRTILGAPSAGRGLAAATVDQREELQRRLRERLPADARGRVTYSATANAVKGLVAAV